MPSPLLKQPVEMKDLFEVVRRCVDYDLPLAISFQKPGLPCQHGHDPVAVEEVEKYYVGLRDKRGRRVGHLRREVLCFLLSPVPNNQVDVLGHQPLRHCLAQVSKPYESRLHDSSL